MAFAGYILQASDDLSRVINSYKKVVDGQSVNGDYEEPKPVVGDGEGTTHKHIRTARTF